MALTTKGHFMVDGTQFLAKNISYKYDSLATEDSGRTDDGVMHISWIRSNMRKYEIEMPPCTAAQASAILSAVQGKIYTLTVFDLKSNSEISLTVYTSNSDGDCYSGVLYNGFYQGIRFSAIEM